MDFELTVLGIVSIVLLANNSLLAADLSAALLAADLLLLWP